MSKVNLDSVRRPAKVAPAGKVEVVCRTAAVSLTAGAPLFVFLLALRASDVERFAARRLPGWPFLTYSWLHVLAVGSLSAALAGLPHREKEAAVLALAALGSGVTLAKTGDIPAVCVLFFRTACGREPPAPAFEVIHPRTDARRKALQ
jgi:hypothetical protein